MSNSLLRATANNAKHTVLEVLEGQQFTGVYGHIGTNLNGNQLDDHEADKMIAGFYRQKNSGKYLAIRMKKTTPKKAGDEHPLGSAEEIIGRMLEMWKGKDLKGKEAILFKAEVYDTNDVSKHGWNIIKNRQFEYGSWEINYSEGKCSICGKSFTDVNDICEHLVKKQLHDGSYAVTSRGKAAILMTNVTPFGWSCMENPGADEDAMIIQAAAARLTKNNKEPEAEMDPKDEGKTPDKGAENVAAKASDLEILKAENEALKAENTELAKTNKKLTDDLAEYQGKEKEALVESIIVAKEARGVIYDEKTRKAYAGKLMGKTDEALAEIKAEVEEIPVKAEAEPTPEADAEPEADPVDDKGKQTSTANRFLDIPKPKSMGDGGKNSDLSDDAKKVRAFINQCEEDDQ